MDNILLKSTVALLVILIVITIYNTYKLHKLDEEPFESMQPPVPMDMGKFYTPANNMLPQRMPHHLQPRMSQDPRQPRMPEPPHMPQHLQPRMPEPPHMPPPQPRNIMHKEIPMRNNMPMNNNMPHYKEMPNNSNIQLNAPTINDMPKEMIDIPGISMDPNEAYKRFHR